MKRGFAGAVVGGGQPVRIRDALKPTMLSFKPGDDVEFRVVSAEGAVEEDGGGGQSRGKQDHGEAKEAIHAECIPRSQGRDPVHPAVLALRMLMAVQQAERVPGLGRLPQPGGEGKANVVPP